MPSGHMTRWFFPAFAALTLILGISMPAGAQSETQSATPPVQSKGPDLHVRTDLRPIAVRVTDKQGVDVKGLSAADFVVLEDGRPQKISFFGSDSVPTSLAVLVDSSSAMDSSGRFGSAEAIAARFVLDSRPGDEISAMDFTDQVGLFQTLTREQIVRSSSFPLTRATSHGSALYDAVASAICHLRASQNLQQVIVVISDGVDEHSRLSLDQLIQLVQQSSRVQLFMIGLNSKSNYNFEGQTGRKMTLVSEREIDNPIYVFDQLSKESGAESDSLKGEQDLERALKRVADVLRAQYTIAYYPEPNPKRFRKIEVRVKERGLKVSARRGVGAASAAGEAVYFTEGTCSVSPKKYPYPYESKVAEGANGSVYHEDFSDPRSGWPNRPESRYAGGRYEITSVLVPKTSVDPTVHDQFERPPVGEVKIPQNVLAAYGPWWQDFRASVLVDSRPVTDFSSLPGGKSGTNPHITSSSAGIVFRLNDEGYYALLLTSTPKGKHPSFEVIKQEYGANAPVEIIPGTVIPFALVPGEQTKLSVEDAGSQITVLVNDQKVGSAQDVSYSQGYAGLIASGHTQAIFHELTVEDIPQHRSSPVISPQP